MAVCSSGYIMLSMLGKDFSRRHFKIFNISFQKLRLTFHINYLLDNLHKMSKPISWESLEKTIVSLSSAKLAQRVSKVVFSGTHSLSMSLNPMYHVHLFRLIITKTRLFKYIKNFTIKTWTFSDKNWYFFHISAQNIDCGYSLEPPRRGGSNEYPQSMFWAEKK